MCLIVDANVAAICLCPEPHPDFQPVINWLLNNEGGRIALGGLLSEELARNKAVQGILVSLNQAGKAKIYENEEIQREIEVIEEKCISDDPHILALARVSNARVLCSRDQRLHEDFTNPHLISRPRGRVYQNATHVALLRNCRTCR